MSPSWNPSPATRKTIAPFLIGLVITLCVMCASTWPGIFSPRTSMDVKVIVEEAGYNDVEVVNWHPIFPAWNGCSNDDAVAYTVTAVTMSRPEDPAERPVDIAVCCGSGLTRFSKGCTIRVR